MNIHKEADLFKKNSRRNRWDVKRFEGIIKNYKEIIKKKMNSSTNKSNDDDDDDVEALYHVKSVALALAQFFYSL